MIRPMCYGGFLTGKKGLSIMEEIRKMREGGLDVYSISFITRFDWVMPNSWWSCNCPVSVRVFSIIQKVFSWWTDSKCNTRLLCLNAFYVFSHSTNGNIVF